jgi:hypothetical protein
MAQALQLREGAPTSPKTVPWALQLRASHLGGLGEFLGETALITEGLSFLNKKNKNKNPPLERT